MDNQPSQTTSISPWEQAREFVDNVLTIENPQSASNASKCEHSVKKAALEQIIRAIHSCTSEAQATSNCCTTDANGLDQSIVLPPAFIAIPGHSEKVVEVCCACCGATVATFIQDPGAAEVESWGMCMAVKLFLGPQNKIFVAIGYEAGHVVVWDLAKAIEKDKNKKISSDVAGIYCRPVAQGKLHSEPIMALEVDADGVSGVSGSAEDKLVAFAIDFEAGRVVPENTINVRKQGVADIALRQDGKLLATAGWDGKVRVYKRASGKALAVLKYHSEAATAVVFSPETYLMASGARDGTIALWDIYCKPKKM